MSISVNDILDVGLLANGKFPDIYWEIDLIGSMIKILRYVYNNCLRLYKDLKYFPKGSDGSPRFWRGKERMADDCGLSYPTFRNGVRSLSKLGLVTSMDAEEDSEELYCIGLSADFLNNFIKREQVDNKTKKDSSLYGLIGLIYNNLTLELIEDNLALELINNRLDKSKLNTETEDLPNKNQPKRVAISVGRKPVFVKRIPIRVTPNKINIQAAQQKLKSLQNIVTPYEREVLKVSEYYEYKCRQAIRSTGFKALGKDFRNHRNWKFFVKIYELCRENNWDFKVYIDSQFDRVKYYQRKQLYPYANQFTSEGAIKYYHNYVKDYKEKYSVTGDITVKAEKIKSVNEQIIDEVIKDCERISGYIEREKKRKINKDLTLEQLKILYLSDHWMGLSASYLASLPWFMTYLEQFPEETFLIDLKQDIQRIKNSKKLFKLTTEIVEKVEKQMGVPDTICL